MNKNKHILVKQLDISDCGAACLSSVLAYYGQYKSVSHIRHEAGTNKNGTSLLGLVNVAKKAGLETNPVKINNKQIDPDDLPAIAHLEIRKSWLHYVVIYGCEGQNYQVMDPATGKILSMEKSRFNEEWSGILLILKPGRNFKTHSKKPSIRRKIYSILYPHRSALIKAVFAAILYSSLGIATAIYIEILTDKIIPSGDLSLLGKYSALLAMVIVVRIFTGYVKNLVMIRTGQKIDSDLINNYNQHILKLPTGFFQSMKTGEILTRINDAIKIRAFINSVAQELIVNVLIVIITMSIMFSYSISLGMVLLSSVPAYLVIYSLLNKTNKKYLRITMETGAEMESRLVETLKGINTIKAFMRENDFYHQLQSICRQLLSGIFKTSRVFALSAHGAELTSSLWMIFILWLGANMVIQGKLSFGELFSFYALYAYLSGPLTSLLLSNRGIQDARIAADRLFQVMELEEEFYGTEEKKKGNHQQPVSVKNLSFSYPGKLKLLRNISFRCEPGTITAIVGESGSGKSTIISLLMSFHKPETGQINIGDFPSDVPVPLIRKQISWVPQHISLFSGTLGENISMKKSEWNPKKMKKAIKLAGLDDLIESLENGLSTYITEDGNNFSGGEKQKIAFARAVYKDAPIFLLDEPSSSMDPKSEKHLGSSLNHFKPEGKTIVVVAHKLSLIRFADQILVIKKGEIIESGDHNSLYNLNGIYTQLWNYQNINTYDDKEVR